MRASTRYQSRHPRIDPTRRLRVHHRLVHSARRPLAVGLFFAALLLGSLVWPGSAHANCVTFYEHSNYGGSSYQQCGTSLYGMAGGWNDRVSSMKVDDGYYLTAYEHGGGGGSQRDFWGDVSYVRDDFNDKISSYRLVAMGSNPRCVSLYEHSDYQGQTWQWCFGESGFDNNPSGWSDKVSSLIIPSDRKITMYKDTGYANMARTYFKDTPDVGWHDNYSSFRLRSFDDESFVMAIISDPQYNYCGSSVDCGFSGGSSDTANQNHIASINELRSDEGDQFAGVITNGDNVHVGDRTEWDYFISNYLSSDWNLYVGFGNHETQYSKDCNSEITVDEECVAWFLDNYGQDVMSSAAHGYDWYFSRSEDLLGYVDLSTSLFHAWDIGQFNFVQLNNYPTFTYSYDAPLVYGKYDLDIVSALDDLETHLYNLPPDKKIILNMHDVIFDGAGIDRRDFVDALTRSGRADDVVAIFAGHIHKYAGQRTWSETVWNDDTGGVWSYRRYIDLGDRTVPVFHGGGAMFNKYLKVEFASEEMIIDVIHSTDVTGTGKYVNYAGHNVVVDIPKSYREFDDFSYVSGTRDRFFDADDGSADGVVTVAENFGCEFSVRNGRLGIYRKTDGAAIWLGADWEAEGTSFVSMLDDGRFICKVPSGTWDCGYDLGLSLPAGKTSHEVIGVKISDSCEVTFYNEDLQAGMNICPDFDHFVASITDENINGGASDKNLKEGSLVSVTLNDGAGGSGTVEYLVDSRNTDYWRYTSALADEVNDSFDSYLVRAGEAGSDGCIDVVNGSQYRNKIWSYSTGASASFNVIEPVQMMSIATGDTLVTGDLIQLTATNTVTGASYYFEYEVEDGADDGRGWIWPQKFSEEINESADSYNTPFRAGEYSTWSGTAEQISEISSWYRNKLWLATDTPGDWDLSYTVAGQVIL